MPDRVELGQATGLTEAKQEVHGISTAFQIKAQNQTLMLSSCLLQQTCLIFLTQWRLTDWNITTEIKGTVD